MFNRYQPLRKDTKEYLDRENAMLSMRRSGTLRDAPLHLHEKIKKMTNEELDDYHSNKKSSEKKLLLAKKM